MKRKLKVLLCATLVIVLMASNGAALAFAEDPQEHSHNSGEPCSEAAHEHADETEIDDNKNGGPPSGSNRRPVSGHSGRTR